MRTTLILAAIAALAFTSVADAKTCTDPTTHKYVKCPAQATAPTKPATAKTTAAPAAKPTMSKTKAGTTFKAPAATPKTASTSGAPHCTKGKPCGKSCIAMDKVCHK